MRAVPRGPADHSGVVDEPVELILTVGLEGEDAHPL
jgi:hypothetical protein